MLPLYDMMMQAQNGKAMEVMAKQFGLAQEQANNAMAALMPAFSEGFKRNAANPYDLGAFLTALGSGNHVKYFEDMTKAFTPQGMEDGNGVLGHLFGSKEISRAIAAQAAQMTGIGQEIYKQMLPVMATTLMGGIFKQSMAPFMGGSQGTSTDNPFAVMAQQWMEATGMAKKPQPAANPFDNPFTQAMQSFFSGGAAAKKDTPNPFADNPFAKAFQDMMAGFSGDTADKTDKSVSPAESLTKLFNTMFDTGLEMQKDYQKSIENIFEQMSRSVDTDDAPPEEKPKK
ncbi:DUF937 domain-containing protein [Sinorhizobium sp. BG8]|uniref:DUF937 domain-containing protein n=1 Tax=Sinorhizobium sp. BG8 TaxID=2613773 RepID=UPI00193CB3EB|nr:DUF937 domain-containing protein [Sinorhizobium sp. BG8]QRM54438.1 DUF937 domain-containing protein [Sinorhizobium sp. BG8]